MRRLLAALRRSRIDPENCEIRAMQAESQARAEWQLNSRLVALLEQAQMRATAAEARLREVEDLVRSDVPAVELGDRLAAVLWRQEAGEVVR